MIVEATQNAFLLRAWERLGFEIRIRIFLASKEFGMVQVAQLHEPIVDALERGDAKRAELLRSHSLGFGAQVGAPRQEPVHHREAGGLVVHRGEGKLLLQTGNNSGRAGEPAASSRQAILTTDRALNVSVGIQETGKVSELLQGQKRDFILP